MLEPQYSSIEKWDLGEGSELQGPRSVDCRDTVLRSGLKFFSHEFILPLEKLEVSRER